MNLFSKETQTHLLLLMGVRNKPAFFPLHLEFTTIPIQSVVAKRFKNIMIKALCKSLRKFDKG
jgi:hypothetical protein